MNSMYRHASRAYVVPRAACAPPLCSNYGSVRLRLFTGVHRTSGGEPSAELLQGAHHCSGTGADRTGPDREEEPPCFYPLLDVTTLIDLLVLA